MTVTDFHDEIEVLIENIRGDLRDWKRLETSSCGYRDRTKICQHKTVEKEYNLLEVDTTSNEKFIKSLNSCINYLCEYIRLDIIY